MKRYVLIILCLAPLLNLYTEDVAVITAGGGKFFWNEIIKGALQAGEDYNLTIYSRGPSDEQNYQSQNAAISTAIERGCKIILLAPTSKEQRVFIKDLKDKGYPTIFIDRDIGGDRVALIETDNYSAGVLAGKKMVKALNGKGRVAILRMAKGLLSTTDREEGFKKTVTELGLEVVFDDYIGVDVGEGRKNSYDILEKLPEIDGVFTPNESTTISTIVSLRRLHREGDIVHIGFDTSDLIYRAIESKDIYGVIIQKPFDIGYNGVKEASKYLNGLTEIEGYKTGFDFINFINISDHLAENDRD